MSRGSVVQVLAVLLSLAAAYVSYNLLAKHLTGSSGAAWFEAGCNPDDEGGGANCAAVLASPYSVWPPRQAQEPKDTGHLPVAFLGLVYFSALTVWLAGVGRPSRSRRWLHMVPLIVVGAGLCGSAWFLYIMLTKINEWCPWCVVTHALNLLIFLCMILMWPRIGTCGAGLQPVEPKGYRPVPQDVGQAFQPVVRPTGKSVPQTRAAHPSPRLLLITLTAMALVAFGQGQLLGRANLARQAGRLKAGFDRCMAAVDRIKADTDRLVRNWQLADFQTFELRSDDPTRTHAAPGESTVQVVLFSDFECESCKRLTTFIEKEAQRLFAGRLSVTFKHYPLCSECNAHVATAFHKHACFAASAAEAARILGGNDAFFSAHDYIFEHQEELKHGALTAETIAVELGIGADAFRTAMQSQQAARRIEEDINLAQTCRVATTPTLFVSGRRVDTMARLVPEFWDRLAETYWRSINEPRPESTRLHRAVGPAFQPVDRQVATPGSQVPPAAP